MTEVQSSFHPSLEKFQSLLGDFMTSGKDFGSNITVGVNGQTIVDICRDHYDEQSMKVSDRDTIVNVWSPTQIILSLITLMLVGRGSLDLNEKLSKYWPEHVAGGGKDVEVREFLSQSANGSGYDKLVTVDDISELVRRTDGRGLDQFIAEEIAGPLRADLHRWLAAERQQSRPVQQQQQQQPSLAKDTTTSTTTAAAATNGHTSSSNGTASKTTAPTKLYPPSIPPHRLHPNLQDFSIVDQGSIGKALVTFRSWSQGDFMARFDGLTVPEVMLHTLQKSDAVHLWDPHFIGTLAHSCNPNVILDMAEHEMWAVQDIEPGTVLSMDYASTEDYLYRTFQCACTAPGCRGEVTGRKQRRSAAAVQTSEKVVNGDTDVNANVNGPNGTV